MLRETTAALLHDPELMADLEILASNIDQRLIVASLAAGHTPPSVPIWNPVNPEFPQLKEQHLTRYVKNLMRDGIVGRQRASAGQRKLFLNPDVEQHAGAISGTLLDWDLVYPDVSLASLLGAGKIIDKYIALYQGFLERSLSHVEADSLTGRTRAPVGFLFKNNIIYNTALENPATTLRISAPPLRHVALGQGWQQAISLPSLRVVRALSAAGTQELSAGSLLAAIQEQIPHIDRQRIVETIGSLISQTSFVRLPGRPSNTHPQRYGLRSIVRPAVSDLLGRLGGLTDTSYRQVAYERCTTLIGDEAALRFLALKGSQAHKSNPELTMPPLPLAFRQRYTAESIGPAAPHR